MLFTESINAKEKRIHGRKIMLERYELTHAALANLKNESSRGNKMRWILKIILFPISLLLSILIAFLTFLLGIGTTVLYLLMLFCIFGAIASFLQKEVTIGIEALIIGFLVSPYGIPMVGATIIAFLQGINKAIKAI
jgi:hypothetical protein